MNWVDAFGTYAGTSVAAHGVTYVIDAQGTLSSFAGISNQTILRETPTGRVEFAAVFSSCASANERATTGS